MLQQIIRELVEVDIISFGFMPCRETRDVLFVVRKKQEKYRKKVEYVFCEYFEDI